MDDVAQWMTLPCSSDVIMPVTTHSIGLGYAISQKCSRTSGRTMSSLVFTLVWNFRCGSLIGGSHTKRESYLLLDSLTGGSHSILRHNKTIIPLKQPTSLQNPLRTTIMDADSACQTTNLGWSWSGSKQGVM